MVFNEESDRASGKIDSSSVLSWRCTRSVNSADQIVVPSIISRRPTDMPNILNLMDLKN
jgi:hypothetical protein